MLHSPRFISFLSPPPLLHLMYTTNCAPNRDIVISSHRSCAIELFWGTLQMSKVRLLFIYIYRSYLARKTKSCLLLSPPSLPSCFHLLLFTFPPSPLSLSNSAAKVATTSTTSPAPAMDSPPAQLLSRAVAQEIIAFLPPLGPVKFSNGATNALLPLRLQRAPSPSLAVRRSPRRTTPRTATRTAATSSSYTSLALGARWEHRSPP